MSQRRGLSNDEELGGAVVAPLSLLLLLDVA
jgi:hypothetical protein